MTPGDYSVPVLRIIQPDGVRSLRPLVTGWKQSGEELQIELKDEVYPIRITLHYRGYGELPLLSRWISIRNEGTEPVTLDAVKSAVWYVPAGMDYRLTHLAGSW